MKVSVIIPTYKRSESLGALLEAFLRQSYDDFEIIVMDQSPPPPKDLNEIITANNDKIKYFTDNTQNAAHARNEGIRNAAGEIIISCDDDIMIKPDFIENHVKNYKEQRVGAVSGRVLCANDLPVSKIKKVGKIRRYDGKIISNFNADFKTEVEHAYGCNVSFRKELLMRTGGYDERLIGTSSFDDADVSFKIRELGYKIVFEPEAEAIHLQSSGGCRDISFEKKMYWYYRNFMLFYLTHMYGVFFPIFILRQIFGVIRRAIAAKNTKVLFDGIRGLKDGFREYRKKN
ncbi:MAG: glycosyltransferase [Candidatus Omnitrophota bacterium]|jgi:GT2 family glycosyltransferase